MKELSDNILIVKSMNFAIRCVRLARYLRENYHDSMLR